ncbi:hypothetical protein COTS27_00021 [Spirochaetota bacterium]|nr:hypothetical protein COTS27_00021 [Spirochaetota bacterium]
MTNILSDFSAWLLPVLIFLMGLLFQAMLVFQMSGLKMNALTIAPKKFLMTPFILILGWFCYEVMGSALMHPGENWLIGRHFGIDTSSLWLYKNFMLYLQSILPGSIFTSNEITTQPFKWNVLAFHGMLAVWPLLIVINGLAHRNKLPGFGLVAMGLFMSGILYPVLGSWSWGDGWLQKLGFHDFLGATVIYSVAGWMTLAGLLMSKTRTTIGLNSRIDPKTDQTVDQKAGHFNHKLRLLSAHALIFFTWAAVCLILTLNQNLLPAHYFLINDLDTSLPNQHSLRLLIAAIYLSGIGGGLTTYVTTRYVLKKSDLLLALSGLLAGPISISACLDQLILLSLSKMVLITSSLIVINSILVIGVAVLFEKIVASDDILKIVPCYLVSGMWGTMASALFIDNIAFLPQFIGITTYAVATFIPALIFFTIIEALLLLGLPTKKPTT